MLVDGFTSQELKENDAKQTEADQMLGLNYVYLQKVYTLISQLLKLISFVRSC